MSGKRTVSRALTLNLALTWDGARWPVRTLPARARIFLQGTAFPRGVAARLLAEDRVREIRVCWVPRLKGGDEVFCDVFHPPGGKRLAFQAVRTVRFGDVLGVVYRRSMPVAS